MISRASLRACSVAGVGGGRRGFSSGRVTHSRTAIRRMLLQEEGSQRKKGPVNFELPRGNEATTVMGETGSKKVKIPKHSARLRNLNKVYLEKITEILSTGELANKLFGRGLELSQVSIHPSLQGINVFWTTSGNPEQDQQTEAILQRHARTVRHELSNERIISHSPPITFLRDDRHHKLQEVERLLGAADFGEDFEPTDPSHHLKAALPTLAMPLESRIKTAIEGLQGEDDQANTDPPDPFEEALKIATSEPPQGEDVGGATPVLPSDLPTMRGDVLGLNTSKIYTMIQQSIKKARAEHRRHDEAGSPSIPLDIHHEESMHSLNNNRKQEMQKWANRYRQMQKKEARKSNREAALLAYPGDLHAEDLQEEVLEVEWEEEDKDDECQ